MPSFLRPVCMAGLCWLILAGAQAAEPATAQTPSPAASANCQADGWDMNRELQAFARTPESATAGSSTARLPLLHRGTLYALRLQAQGEVHFVQPPGRPGKAVTPMAGLSHFTVSAAGRYRITVDSPLWIDVVTAQGVIPPSAYTGWHECSVYRKSVDYTLGAGQTVTLQFSDAATDLVKVTIEPPPAS
jgi:hypothetical protein